MLHIENEYIREHLLDGAFGIEMESLRILEDGTFHRRYILFRGMHISSETSVKTKPKLIQE